MDSSFSVTGSFIITDNNDNKVYHALDHSFIHSLVFSPRGRSGRSQSPVMEPIWLLAHCILGKFLGVVGHCFPPPLDVPTSPPRASASAATREILAAKGGTVGEKDVR